MQKITTAAELKNAIQNLEYKQANEWPLLKEQFHTTYESVKPINMLKNSIKDFFSATDIKTNIVNAAMGITTGIVAKKAFVGGSHNPLTKLLGFFLEMAVANKVVKNADEIKTAGSAILNKILNKQEDDSEKNNGDCF